MIMHELPMEIRSVDSDGRTVDGVCVPYDEISYFTPNPAGERVLRGAFAKSTAQQANRIFLFRGHDHARPIGRAVEFSDQPDGLHGTFRIRASVLGDETISDLSEGFLPAMSVGFRPLQTRRGARGETEIVEAQLKEVSLVSIGAYDGARVLALRGPVVIPGQVQVDLSPTLPGWVYAVR
jgi:HK97 family phage prohead protease